MTTTLLDFMPLLRKKWHGFLQLTLIQNQSLISFICLLEGDYFFTQVLLGHFYFHTYHCRLNFELRNSKKPPQKQKLAKLNCCRGHGFITVSIFLPFRCIFRRFGYHDRRRDRVKHTPLKEVKYSE